MNLKLKNHNFSEKQVHQRLYDRFYSNGKIKGDKLASSHWKEYSNKFIVNKLADNEFSTIGYGFGDQDSGRLRDRIISFIGNFLKLLYLKNYGLLNEIRIAIKIVNRMGLSFSQDAFRQVCTLNLLLKINKKGESPENILIIGDGKGVLSALLHSYYPKAQIILVDLGSVLFFQSYYLKKAFPEINQSIADEEDPAGGFIFCPSDNIDLIPNCKIDLAFNVASMQEMDPSTIKDYFKLLRARKTKLFYCCNRLEKYLVGGEITRFMEYPWQLDDEHIVDELCAWHKWYFGLGSNPNLKFFGIPLPFIHYYDGLSWHRLTKFHDHSNED